MVYTALFACFPWTPARAQEIPQHTLSRNCAGVRIVDLPSMSTVTARFEVSGEPIYRVGWDERDHAFEDVVDGAFLADGRAVVADGGSTLEVVVFSVEGAVNAILGHPGGGPGEFSDIFAILPRRSGPSPSDEPHCTNRPGK